MKKKVFTFIREYYSLLGVAMLSICLLSGCKPKTVSVFVPAKYDLSKYGVFGIIDFKSNADSSIDRYAVKQFQEYTQAGQVGTGFIELGSMEDILSEFGVDHLDALTIRKIGEKYNVGAVFCGDIKYSEVQPKVDLKDLLSMKVGIKAYLHATLSAQLKETASGAVVWSRSASYKMPLGGLQHTGGGSVSFGVDGYNDAHRKLVHDMVNDVTDDFRGHYVQQPVNSAMTYSPQNNSQI